MLGLLETKSVQTSILAGVLFYLFANPSTFKMVKKIPGLKFVMKSATEITHSGVVVHSLLFGAVLFVCVWLINRSLFLKHYLNVVEGYKEHGDGLPEGTENEGENGGSAEGDDAASEVDESDERRRDTDEDAEAHVEQHTAGHKYD
jgi:hypothetical protein